MKKSRIFSSAWTLMRLPPEQVLEVQQVGKSEPQRQVAEF